MTRNRAALFGVLLACGCASPPEFYEIALRFGPEYFHVEGAKARGEHVGIGDEIRPVVADRARIDILEPVRIDPEAGPFRIPIQIPAAAKELPDSSYVLRMAELDTERGLFGMLNQLAGGGWAPVDAGWSIVRDAEPASAAELVITAAVVEKPSFVRLEARRPLASRLETTALELPRDSQLELAWGLTEPDATAGDAAVEFRALLDCPGRAPRTLLARWVDPVSEEDRRWHRELVGLGGSTGCRLVLETKTTVPGVDLGPVWAVPRVFRPVVPTETFDDRNLVLISLDTLRADHVSGYGYFRQTSPAIDRLLIAQGTTFVDASTTYPMTNVAHMSAFTGLYPEAFGANRGFLPADTGVRTVAEALRDAGFETAAITEDGLVAGQRGFWHGFDVMVERTGTGLIHETFADGAAYLRAHRDRKFFLFLHTYQVHVPYDPADDYDGLFRFEGAHESLIPAEHRRAAADYDREIRETDVALEALLAELARLDLDRRTYVIVFSDHGEAFGEHGQLTHGWAPHEEQLRVPFIIRGPDVVRGRRVPLPVSLVDLKPTILELLDVPATTEAQGVSLAAAARGGEPPDARPVYFEWVGHAAPRGVRFGRYKLVRYDKVRERDVLFDLVTDPAELHPIQGPHPAREEGERFLAAYESGGATLGHTLGTDESTDKPEATGARIKEALRALGYIE